MSPIAWLPDWAFFCLVIVLAIFGLALLLMPFAVFGLKPRLQEVELQLSELRADMRALSQKFAEPVSRHELQSERSPVVEAQPAAFVVEEPAQERRPDPLRPGNGYMDPPRAERHVVSAYEDTPIMARPEQILRPTRFEPPSRETGWSRAPWEDRNQTAAPYSAREELHPRGGSASGNAPDRDDTRRNRSEPTLRWPPRGE